jgi:hypothetical protein
MADQKIHEYPIERFVFGDDDYYDVDFWDGFIYQTAKIKGSVIKSAILSGIAINLTAPSAFIVGGSPTDGTGTLSLTGAGLANQYIRGDGTLATLPTSGGGGNSVNYYLNGGTAASVALYYQMSKTAVIGTGVDFSLAGNGLISQWLTDVGDPNVTEIPSGNWNFEMYFSASSSGGVPKFYIELLKYDGVTFTSIANSSLTPEGITSGTAIDLYLTSLAVPLTSLAIGDRLGIRVYIVDSVLGRTITHHTQDSHLCQITTTFSSGLSSINGLTEQTQYLAVGTSGTDFAINSVTDTHTFNLPTASATNRGALSTTDWSTFNGKQNPITLTTIGSGVATFVADVLNIPSPTSGITVGTTPITSGTTRQVFFQDGTVVSQSVNLVFDASSQLVIGGHTGGARIDVKAGGALSTDLLQKWTSSAGAQLGKFTGDGAVTFGTYTNPSTKLSIDNGASTGAYIGGLKGVYAVGNASGTAYGVDALGRSTASGGTSYGVYAIADGGTGNAVNYGIKGQASGAGLTNYAGYFDAVNGTTNYAIYVQRGDMVFGVSPTLNKIGFFGVTPIAQPTAVTTPQGIADALTNLGLLASSTIPTDPAGWTTIVKSANQDVTNSATMVDDTDLQFSVVAGGHYMLELDLVSSASNLTGDYKGAFKVTVGTMKGNGVITFLSASATATIAILNANSVATTNDSIIGTPIADIDHLVSSKFIYSFTASANATFSFQFANSAAAVGRISRTWKGSILKYKRID